MSHGFSNEAYFWHLRFPQPSLDAAPLIHSEALIWIALKGLALRSFIILALRIPFLAPSGIVGILLLLWRFRLRCQPSSFVFCRSCVGSTSFGYSCAFFLLRFLNSLEVFNVAIVTLACKNIMSQTILMPTFAIAAVERIWDCIRRYPSHDHCAPRLGAPNLDSHRHSDRVSRQTVNDPMIAKFVWYSRLSIDHRKIGDDSVSIGK